MDLLRFAVLSLLITQNPAPGEAQCLLDEVRVELAWNADPMTFPYPLVVVAANDALKVYGSLPNKAVAGRALQTARDNSSLPVQVFIEIRPSLPPRSGPDSLGVFDRLLHQALAETFPTRLAEVTLKPDATGCVIVTGSLPSHEERRALNRRLSQVRGCTSVVNQVKVTPFVHQDQPCVRVSADGRLLIAAADEPATLSPPASSAPTNPCVWGSPYARIVQAAFNQQQGGQAVPPTQAPPATTVSPYQVKRQVERACGMAAKQVQVSGAPGGGLHVRVKVRSEQDGQRLLDTLMKLPELAEYQVQFLVQVER